VGAGAVVVGAALEVQEPPAPINAAKGKSA